MKGSEYPSVNEDSNACRNTDMLLPQKDTPIPIISSRSWNAPRTGRI